MIEVLVIAEDNASGSGLLQKYIGNDLTKILQQIAEDHSYGTGSNVQIKILKQIDRSNGDGCNYIFAIIADNKLIFQCTKVETINIDEDENGIVDHFFDIGSKS